jgi:hypothetical protein
VIDIIILNSITDDLVLQREDSICPCKIPRQIDLLFRECRKSKNGTGTNLRPI